MPRSSALLCFVLLGSAPGFAQDMQEDAKVQRDLDKAKADIDKKYAGRETKDLSPEERRQRAQDENAAAQKVYDDHGTDAKTFNKEKGRMNRSDKQELNDQVSSLKKKDEEAAAAAQKKPEPEQKVVVEYGNQKDKQPDKTADKDSGKKKKKHKDDE